MRPRFDLSGFQVLRWPRTSAARGLSDAREAGRQGVTVRRNWSSQARWLSAFLVVVAGAIMFSGFVSGRDNTAVAWPDTNHVVLPYSTGGSIDTWLEEDHFYFDANEGDVISAEASAYGENRSVKIELYGPLGYVKSDSSSSFMLFPARITHTATTTGRYEVRVCEGLFSETPFSYSLSIRFQSRGTTTTTFQPPSTTTTTSPYSSVFWDVPSSHPYCSAIEQLAEHGVVDGQRDGSFGLYQPILRQQFAKMLVNLLGFTPTEGDVCLFPDVEKPSTDLYPDNFVAVAAKNGLVTGYADGRFGPYDDITRAQVLTMAVRAAPLAGLPLDEPDSAYYNSAVNRLRTFNDPTHGRNAQLAEFNGLCWGLVLDADYGWNPWNLATRGEVAQILFNLAYLAQESSTASAASFQGLREGDKNGWEPQPTPDQDEHSTSPTVTTLPPN